MFWFIKCMNVIETIYWIFKRLVGFNDLLRISHDKIIEVETYRYVVSGSIYISTTCNSFSEYIYIFRYSLSRFFFGNVLVLM